MSQPPPSAPPPDLKALAALSICAVIWGTTWFAITFQLGDVDPVVSIVCRFGLASALIFLGCLVTRRSMRLTRNQHLAAAAQGGCAFSISYAFVYAAEGLIASGVVAVLFAALAFVNLALFRVLANQKAAALAWGGAALGVVGVAVLSAGEIGGVGLGGEEAGLGVAFALLAVLASAFGNYFAWRGQIAGSAILPSTAWAMGYGAAALAIFGLLTGVEWRLSSEPAYVISLLYLSVFGSVVAFVLYFGLARSRGYALASYVSALTPPIAIAVSAIFEKALITGWTIGGLLLVLAGQALLLKAPRASAA